MPWLQLEQSRLDSEFRRHIFDRERSLVLIEIIDNLLDHAAKG
jgi:hypothetical protein